MWISGFAYLKLSVVVTAGLTIYGKLLYLFKESAHGGATLIASSRGGPLDVGMWQYLGLRPCAWEGWPRTL